MDLEMNNTRLDRYFLIYPFSPLPLIFSIARYNKIKYFVKTSDMGFISGNFPIGMKMAFFVKKRFGRWRVTVITKVKRVILMGTFIMIGIKKDVQSDPCYQ
jgi:hypothetical protein